MPIALLINSTLSFYVFVPEGTVSCLYRFVDILHDPSIQILLIKPIHLPTDLSQRVVNHNEQKHTLIEMYLTE